MPVSTLKRWAEEKIVPVRKGRWTAAAAAQARVVARDRKTGAVGSVLHTFEVAAPPAGS